MGVVSRNLHENILGVVAFRNFRHAIQISRSDAADVSPRPNCLVPEIYQLRDASVLHLVTNGKVKNINVHESRNSKNRQHCMEIAVRNNERGETID